MIKHPPSENTLVHHPDRPVSVNWTVTTKCNYKCRYCFARFPGITTSLSPGQMRRIPSLLRDLGCEKVTFVGGEPTLCPQLPELLRLSKSCGLTTMLVTNGTTLIDGFLNDNHEAIDWVALSIDSQYESINQTLGRGWGNHVEQTERCAERIHELGIRLKINTVVTRLTCSEDMSELILSLMPDRWKVFQVLAVRGQNDGSVGELLVSSEDFDCFRRTHHLLTAKGLNTVFENNELMSESYVMLNSLGCFFTNRKGYYEIGPSIFAHETNHAFIDRHWDTVKFVQRGGLYDWGNLNSPSAARGC